MPRLLPPIDIATYEGTCPNCREPIEVGAVVRRRVQIWVHKRCYRDTFQWRRCGAKNTTQPGRCKSVVPPGEVRCRAHSGGAS